MKHSWVWRLGDINTFTFDSGDLPDDSTQPTDYSFEAESDATVFHIEGLTLDEDPDRHGPLELGVAFGIYIQSDPIAPNEGIFLPIMVLE